MRAPEVNTSDTECNLASQHKSIDKRGHATMQIMTAGVTVTQSHAHTNDVRHRRKNNRACAPHETLPKSRTPVTKPS